MLDSSISWIERSDIGERKKKNWWRIKKSIDTDNVEESKVAFLNLINFLESSTEK